MFGLLRTTGKPTQVRTAPRFARLGLERLEQREVPAMLTLSVSSVSGRVVNLSGTLSGVSNPSMQPISFSGMATDSTMTNSMGQFSLNTPGMGLGDVTATVTTPDGSTATATAPIVDVTPSLALNAIEYPGHLWVFTGDVTYTGRDLQWLPVSFGGVPVSLQYRATMTDSSGHFSMSVYLNGTNSDNGTVWAKVTTPWGTESEMALSDVHQSGT
jgi:hypothetical protein